MEDTLYLHKCGIELTDIEKALIIHAIRRFGGDDHPWPDLNTVDGFAVEYCVECLSAVLNRVSQWPEGQRDTVIQLKQKLESILNNSV